MTNQFADYVRDIQNRVRGCRVLDIGCLATAKRNILVRHKEYRKYTKEMIGIDYNKEFLEIVKLSGEKNIYHVDITNNTQVEKFIEQFGIFNHIIATDIIEHIGNLTLFLDNVYKLMSDEAKLYLTTPNAMCPNWIYWCIEGNGETKVNPDHICFFDIKTLRSLLRRSNLKIKEFSYQKTGTERVKKLGLKPAPWMGKRIYVIVTK